MNHKTTKIRKATINDIDEILNIETQSFGKHHWSHEAFTNELTNEYATYLICELISEPNKIIGYTGYWIINDEGHITTLAVDPKYRRKHIADILLYSLICNAITHKIKWLTLEVRVSNIAALNLYTKFYFNQLGIRKKYYQDNNEDALLLWSDDISNKAYIEKIKTVISNIITEVDVTDKLQYIN